MNAKIAILSGTYHQYELYILTQAPDTEQYIYASSPAALKGVALVDYEVIGTFYERIDAKEILEVATAAMLLKKESEMSNKPVTYEKTVIRSLTLLVALVLGSIILGVGTCISFDRDMERLCMERGGNFNVTVGCYQPVTNE